MRPEKHHAVVFEGDRDAGILAAHAYVTDVLGLTILQNPDVTIEIHERVTVDIAATLKSRASQRPFGNARAFIIGCETILHEAQNALLKLLEEPADHTHFIFVLPSVDVLLPTVRSRMLIAGRVQQQVTAWDTAEQFVNASPAERSKIIAPLLKDKNRAGSQELVRLVERYLHMQGFQKNAQKLEEVALAQRYLNNRSSSLKMLLEHLAVTL